MMKMKLILSMLILLMATAAFASEKFKTCGEDFPGSENATIVKFADRCEKIFGALHSTKTAIDGLTDKPVVWRLVAQGETGLQSWWNTGFNQNDHDEQLIWTSYANDADPEEYGELAGWCGDGSIFGNGPSDVSWGTGMNADEIRRAQQMGLSKVVPDVANHVYWTDSRLNEKKAIAFNGKKGALELKKPSTGLFFMCVQRVTTGNP